MAEITTVTLNQLSSLTRGSEVTAVKNNTSANTPQPLNNVAASVVVSQVNSKTVTLTNPQNKQSVELPASALRNLGNVKTGQSFELVGIPNKPNTYALIPLALSNRPSAALSSQSQVLANTKVNVNDNQLNSLVSKATAAGEVSFSGKPIINVSGRITAISANQVSVSFTLPGSNLPPQQAQITLSKAQASALNINTKVNIAIDVSDKQAKIVSLSKTNAQGQNIASSTIQFSAQLSQLNNAALPPKLISSVILQQLAANQQLAGNLQGTQVNIQANASAKNTVPNLTQAIIPLTDAKLAELPKTLVASLQAALAKVNTTGASQVALVIESVGNNNSLKLSVVGNLNKSSVELNTSQVRALIAKVDLKQSSDTAAPDRAQLTGAQARGAQLTGAQARGAQNTLTQTANNQAISDAAAKVSNSPATRANIADAVSTNIAKQGFIASRAELIAQQVGNLVAKDSVTNPNTVGANPSSVAASEQQSIQNFKTNALLEQLTKFISTSSEANAAGNAKLNLDALKNQVQALIKQTSSQTATQTQTLTNILNALSNEGDIEALGNETQTLLRNIRELLPAATTPTAPIDARSIQQLIGAPLNNAPINALSPTAASGFLSGLVTLLQVSLATQLQRQSNKQASKLQDQIPDVIKSVVPGIQKTTSSKLMQDFRQFDAKHTLSAEVAKMLFSHQHHKLKSIESSLQGQDQLYYALPNTFSKNADDIELLVKRETRENESKPNEAGVSSWYLTMKLDVGPLGQMLAKTQLTEDEIKLQLYTSTTELRNKALDMLPFLQRRLSALGINLTDKSCQLGKIPKQLKSEHYQVFETQV
ncbi:flagellar hook-length control protein FliK [Glaciecola sp. MF2-115]|uniref:flagellar hook-length control protein FliK n=1 Tax=Glaciecola sp. MF2-115 TaxID=3384827 RepID=UPI0039A218EF